MLARFFFGPGSRYSYLASTQIAGIAARTGARFVWKAVYGPDLRKRTGHDPFTAPVGQYALAYRDADVQRWAAHYGVPFVEPPKREIDWLLLTRACAAADMLGAGEAFARAVFAANFAMGAPPDSDAALERLVQMIGLPEHAFQGALACAAERLAAHAEEAAACGAFGVPTFVTDDGALFFGQDRLVLLERHLRERG